MHTASIQSFRLAKGRRNVCKAEKRFSVIDRMEGLVVIVSVICFEKIGAPQV
jgi:hypothetical protein